MTDVDDLSRPPTFLEHTAALTDLLLRAIVSERNYINSLAKKRTEIIASLPEEKTNKLKEIDKEFKIHNYKVEQNVRRIVTMFHVLWRIEEGDIENVEISSDKAEEELAKYCEVSEAEYQEVLKKINALSKKIRAEENH